MSSGVVQIGEVWKMLDECAPGHTRVSYGDHKWDIRWKSARFPRLPLGAHGRKRQSGRAEVELTAPRSISPNSSTDARKPGELVYQTHEILEQDVVDTLLGPSNQAEFLSEIDDRQLREAVIRELMVGEVLPAMRAQPGGTAVGLNVQWSLGSHTLLTGE